METADNSKTLCLIPCFNEAPNLPQLLAELGDAVLQERCDLLFLDDASTDATPELLQASGHAVLRQPENGGYGAAIKAGLRYGRERGYARMAVFPGDRQRSIADLLRLVAAAEQGGHDLVIGGKLHDRHGIPWRRSWGNRFFSRLAAAWWGTPFRDVLSGFKVYRIAAVVPLLDSLPDRYEFDLVLSAYCGKLGLRAQEMPVSVRYHDHSTKMRSTVAVGLRMLRAAIKFQFARGAKPIAYPVEER